LNALAEAFLTTVATYVSSLISAHEL